MRELKLGFGGIVILLVFENGYCRFKLEVPYQHFISDEKPDIAFQVHYGGIPEWELKQIVFNPGVNWSMFRYNGRYILKANNRLIALEPDFRFGHIYIEDSYPRKSSIAPLDYPLDEVLMINLLARGRGVIVHACGVNNRNKGLLFMGNSGAGKSTIANLWKSQNNATILSDDRIIIRKIKGRFWIYGTPWHGDAKVYSPDRAPLEKIFFLKHAKEDTVRKITLREAASRLITCSFPTFWDKKGMEFTLNFCSELAQEIPCYELGFVPDSRVLEFVKDGCNKSKKDRFLKFEQGNTE